MWIQAIDCRLVVDKQLLLRACKEKRVKEKRKKEKGKREK